MEADTLRHTYLLSICVAVAPANPLVMSHHAFRELFPQLWRSLSCDNNTCVKSFPRILNLSLIIDQNTLPSRVCSRESAAPLLLSIALGHRQPGRR